MQYANLGNTGLVVSRIAFGAMTFGNGKLAGDLMNNLDQAAAEKMVLKALEAGVNFFDTSDAYTAGQSENILGVILKNRRDDVVIATTCGARTGEAVTSAGLSYRHILKAAEASLKRLRTDYIDLYQLHGPDPVTPFEETARALEHLVQKGWVRYAGFSNFTAWKAQKLLDLQEKMGFKKMVSAQMYYSLLGRDLEHEYIPFLEANRLGLMAWSPLSSGFLAGKYTRQNPVPADGRRAKLNFPPVNVEKGYEVVEKLREFAERYRASVAQIALAWLLAKPHVSSVIIGATKMLQMEDNLKAADVKLSPDDVKTLDGMTASAPPYPAWMQDMGFDAKLKAALGA